jgi:diguanylate cyclase (GGDEF)-like protein
MSLFAKSVLVIVLIALFSILMAMSVRYFIVLPEMLVLEQAADQKDIDRVEQGFSMLEQNLARFTLDYALWDDTVDFIQHRNADYIESNFVLESFIQNDINFVLIADEEGKTLWGRTANLYTGQFFETLDESLYQNYLPWLMERLEASERGLISGYLNPYFGPVVFAMAKVRDSHGKGESPGFVLMARGVGLGAIADLQRIAGLEFSLVSHDAHKPTGVFTFPMPAQKVIRNADNELRWTIFDSLEQPLFDITLQQPKRAFSDALLSVDVKIGIAVIVVGWILILSMFWRGIIHPVVKVALFLRGVRDSGDYSQRLVLAERKDEVSILFEETNRLLAHVEQQSSELKALSDTDALTNLGNRRYFDRELDNHWALSRRNKASLALIICDIDYFKRYNDHYGHPAGDQALQKVAGALASCIKRQSDAVARIGGEEFAVILPDTASDDARHIAESMRRAVEALALEHELADSAYVSLSLGLALSDQADIDSTQKLIDAADEALYRAKHQGRNRVVVFGA